MSHTVELNVFEPFDLIKTAVEDYGTFERLLHDDTSVEEIWCNLEDALLIQVSVDGEFAGFFSLEDVSILKRRVCEVHAFIVPKMRKYSLQIMKDFKNYLFDVSPFQSILTQTSTSLPAMDRVLKMVGFHYFDERKDTHSFNSVSYDSHFFFIDKE